MPIEVIIIIYHNMAKSITISTKGQVSPIMMINNVKILLSEDMINMKNHRQGNRVLDMILLFSLTGRNQMGRLSWKTIKFNRNSSFTETLIQKEPILIILMNNVSPLKLHWKKEIPQHNTSDIIKDAVD